MKNLNITHSGLRIVRRFNTPKENVFNAFASSDAFCEWWAQEGTTITVVQFTFAPQGRLHYKMQNGDKVMWGLFRFGTIITNEVIEFVNSFSDEHGGITKPPFPMDFPLEIFNRITLDEVDGVTTLILEGHPINATEAQLETYNSIKGHLEKGFDSTFNQLGKYLKEKL